ncbi:MAG: MBL fold metallo-hydrolase, partial [Candidatus Sumerlaeota bacterium]|nr:MBL fold metallo-hydrolase [Candidatus Sumerlaeota bacterium]
MTASKPAETLFHVVDLGMGNTIFVTAPSGEVLLIDAGSSRMAERLLAFVEQRGIRQIDYLLISHFENDHMGAAARLAEKVPVRHFVDHGECVTYAKDDAWWRQRRGLWFREGMSRQFDQSWEAYRAARDQARHIVVQPGDRVPIQGLDVVVVSSGGRIIAEPLDEAKGAKAFCDRFERRADDDSEDAQSVGVIVRYGRFRFACLGDLGWNLANSLFCPRNLIGTVDAYLVTHHGFSMSREHGDYFHGLSSCPPAETHGLSPRAAILTLGSNGHKHGTPDAMKAVHGVPGLDLWQIEYVREGGEAGYNGPEPYIANLGERSDT